MVVVIKRASKEEIPALSKELLTLLRDKDSEIYQDNVAKFGVSEDYVRRAFSEDTLLEAALSGQSGFFLALEDGEIIGFAQVVKKDATTTELDRIIVFPEHVGRGIGTRLLHDVISDARRRGVNSIVVSAGKEETHARRFYEKNGFRQAKETTIEAPWGKRLALVIYELRLSE